MDQGEEPESQMAGQRATYLEENCSETYMANWGAIDGSVQHSWWEAVQR